ncbi:O-antigen ligase family protein [Embleya sp. NPDC005575]|uniref:O-antigen ligase family protein n=1 Tax=Embleya sp. NPDC005575 TaxID=3156892 RepID=UPI0033A457C0
MGTDRERDQQVRSSARYLSRLDLLGTAVVAATAMWALVAAANRAGEPEAFLLALLAAVGGYVLGRLLGARCALLAPAVVAGAVAGMLVLWPGALSGDATAPPLHYGNANGALVAQAVGGACLTALFAVSDRRRGEILVLAGLLVLAAFATRSVAAAVGAVVVLLAGLLSASAYRKGMVVLVAAVCVVGVALGTVVLGALGTRTGGLKGAAQAGLTERRVQLWGDGVHLTNSHPLRGMGPGMFVTNSPTASSDADVHSAHSLWLRHSAEQGVPGALCLVALVGWVYVRLWRSPQPVAVVVVGSATFTAFVVQASIDYVAEFPVVLVAVGLLTGAATAGPDPELRARLARGGL